MPIVPHVIKIRKRFAGQASEREKMKKEKFRLIETSHQSKVVSLGNQVLLVLVELSSNSD